MPTKFVITGFGQFAGVQSNPTQHLVEWLAAKQQEHTKHQVSCTALTDTCKQGGTSAVHKDSTAATCRFLGTAVTEGAAYDIVSCEVLEVSGQAVSRFLDEQQAMLREACRGSDQTLVLLHLGVDTEGTCLKLESRAFNNAHFRCPDQSGWQPSNALIEQGEGLAINSTRVTPLPLQEIVNQLRAAGFDCQVSQDAGRFVCNYTYYKSLCLAASMCDATRGSTGSGCVGNKDNQDASAADAVDPGQSSGSCCSCNTTATEVSCNQDSSTNMEQQDSNYKTHREGRQTATAPISVGDCPNHPCYSLFVHVPPFKVVSDTQQQEFLLMLLQCIDSVLRSQQETAMQVHR